MIPVSFALPLGAHPASQTTRLPVLGSGTGGGGAPVSGAAETPSAATARAVIFVCGQYDVCRAPDAQIDLGAP